MAQGFWLRIVFFREDNELGCTARPSGRNQMDSWEKRFVEPAKLAGRVLAPGEGSAEPGDAKPKRV